MTRQMIDEVLQRKKQLRAEASARRAEQTDAHHASQQIFQQIAALPEYARARTVMLYLDMLSEVRTRWFLSTAWSEGKHVVVPYCENGELELFRLDHVGELAPGTIGVLEPRRELRGHPDRKIARSGPDLIVIPGLAFDRGGGRLGYGKGYYDRFLCHIRGDATRVAVCFECQLVAEVPRLPHDIRMDMIVTEKAVYKTGG